MAQTVEIKTRPCPECHEVATLTVTVDDLARYNHGALIQDAFPTMSKDDRERLVTGICGPCWALIFADEDDEDEDGDEPFAEDYMDPPEGWREGQPEFNGAFR
jgi:hypothetical protein